MLADALRKIDYLWHYKMENKTSRECMMNLSSNPDEIRMTVPADESLLYCVTGAARYYAEFAGFHEEDAYKIELAVEEAVMNVIHHGLSEEDGRPTFEIAFSISTPRGICIRIREKGLPFDPFGISTYDPHHASVDAPVSGLGVHLIRNMMDLVEYRNLGLEGKETLLLKYCDAETDSDASAPVESPATTDEPESALKQPLSFTVRRMEPSDALDISRGAYRSHGYTFFEDFIYYPEKIRELNESNRMISAVAVTDRGEFMGHGALVFSEPDGDRIAEMNFFFVNKKFRQQNCLFQLGHFLVQEGLKENLAGIYALMVTVHVFTQKKALQAIGSPLAIMLASTPMTMEFRGISGRLNQRISTVLMFLYLQPPGAKRLYAPAHHREMIRLLYNSLHAGHTLESTPPAGDGTRKDDSELRTDVSEIENCADVWVLRTGSNVVDAVRRTLRMLNVGGTATVLLYLSLEDGTAAVYTDDFEKMGFFFAGIFPDTSIGDVMILQNLNNIDLDYSTIKIMPGETEILLDYIRRCDPNQQRQLSPEHPAR